MAEIIRVRQKWNDNVLTASLIPTPDFMKTTKVCDTDELAYDAGDWVIKERYDNGTSLNPLYVTMINMDKGGEYPTPENWVDGYESSLYEVLEVVK